MLHMYWRYQTSAMPWHIEHCQIIVVLLRLIVSQKVTCSDGSTVSSFCHNGSVVVMKQHQSDGQYLHLLATLTSRQYSHCLWYMLIYALHIDRF